MLSAKVVKYFEHALLPLRGTGESRGAAPRPQRLLLLHARLVNLQTNFQSEDSVLASFIPDVLEQLLFAMLMRASVLFCLMAGSYLMSS